MSDIVFVATGPAIFGALAAYVVIPRKIQCSRT